MEIPEKEAALKDLGEEGVLDRLSVFSDEFSSQLLLRELEDCRKAGDSLGVSRIAEKVSKRLFDLSLFMKEL